MVCDNYKCIILNSRSICKIKPLGVLTCNFIYWFDFLLSDFSDNSQRYKQK